VDEQPSFSELEWAKRVARVMGWTGEVVVLSPDAMPVHLQMPGRLEQHWAVDSSRIRSELGYSEQLPLDAAIAETVAWQRAHPPTAPLARFDYAAEDVAIAAARRAN
jgi:nucleoside-diphosphate-sugar epimerase